VREWRLEEKAEAVKLKAEADAVMKGKK